MEATINKRLLLFSGSRHTKLADDVAKRLGIKVSDAKLQQFANGEVKCRLDESVRGADVFIIQTHYQPVAEAIIEQAVLIDAAKRASARHITAVCPLLGYSRQDRKSSGREPITGRLVVDILKVAGADRIVSVDLHSGQVQGFFNGPFDHLISMPALADYLHNQFGQDFVIVSPDAGRVKLAERYASRLGVDLAIVHKQRTTAKMPDALDVIGNIEGKRCAIIDDMIDTAGTICAAAELLKKRGATSVVAVATHGLFSDPAAERLIASPIDHIAVTDTLPFPENPKLRKKLTTVSIVDLLANAIQAIFEERSVSAIFDGENQS
jgi:ribose-phosphate pyrophosphokinase